MSTDNTEALRAFALLLNSEPDPSWIEATPDGKAKTINISYQETNLDTVFNACWGTRNFTTKLIANEVVGEIELFFIHPVLGIEFTRVGAAAITVTVDALTKEQKDVMTKQQINLHALNPENKKSNALDMAYPKLKAECLVNAAKGLGKLFGRDLNRKRVSKSVPKLLQATDGLVKQLETALINGDLTAVERAKRNGIVFEDMQLTYLDSVVERKQLA